MIDRSPLCIEANGFDGYKNCLGLTIKNEIEFFIVIKGLPYCKKDDDDDDDR